MEIRRNDYDNGNSVVGVYLEEAEEPADCVIAGKRGGDDRETGMPGQDGGPFAMSAIIHRGIGQFLSESYISASVLRNNQVNYNNIACDIMYLASTTMPYE